MNTHQAAEAYIEELAARSTLIAHDASSTASREARRFFLWGSEDGKLQAHYALNNKGWNLLLDNVDGKNVDNRHDSEAHTHRLALHFVRQTRADDFAAQRATIAAAYDLGWLFLRRIRKHTQNACKAVNDGEISSASIVPRMIDWPAISYQALDPLLFVGDHHYGYRFEVILRYDQPNIVAENTDDWRTP